MKLVGTLFLSVLLLSSCTQKPEVPLTYPPKTPASTTLSQPSPSIKANQVFPTAKTIPQTFHVPQTFNNCGPATFSMLLSYSGITLDQNTLGQDLRPYQNPKGDNDDKSVTMSELSTYAEKLNLHPYYRPNGTIDTIKYHISNNRPVVLRTWLNDHEDIGHFILVRGYNDPQKQFIIDDSYYGPNRTLSYDTVVGRWQPFNYEYLVLSAEPLSSEEDLQTAWQKALSRAENETTPENPYPIFNQAVAHYELGDYQKTIDLYESVQNKLPKRMLWYQLQPIQAYQKLKNKEKVFTITDTILTNHNRAFSELYYIRAQAYLDENNPTAAKSELQNALKYNQNYTAAKDLLSSLP
jgi:tetratricopeptide (TPR) repeat protein